MQLTIPGMEHYSFSDEVLLREAKDGTKEKQGAALHNLRVTEDITRAFLDEVLRNQPQTTLRDNPEMTIKHFGRAN